MLKKLVEIDPKCFRQFKWGALTELARFNLFYGWNGTGKTTLSNLLADLDRKAPIEIGKVVFRIANMNTTRRALRAFCGDGFIGVVTLHPEQENHTHG